MHRVVAAITLRQLLGRRRIVLLLALGGVLVLIGLIYRLSDPFSFEVAGWTATLLDRFGIAVVLPLVALIFGTGAIGAEIEDGTIVHLLAKPIARLGIVLSKLAVAGGLTVVLAVAPIAVAGLLAVGESGAERLVLAFSLAAAAGAVVYAALFLALSLVSRRALVLGLLYLLIWEGLVAGLFVGTRTFSVRQHVLAWADAISGAEASVIEAALDPLTACLVAAGIVLGSIAVATRSLGGFELRGETP
jgi:ABC-2 type transport system permease protein